MEHLKRAKRNALLTYGIYGFENASATLPIWLLFFTRQLGFSVTAAIVLAMTRWMVIAIFNIPTGAWADRFGRAKIYRIGQFFYALSMVPFLLTNNFAILFIVQIIGGFVGAMSIGALMPLVKDAYSFAEIPDQKYTNFLSNRSIVVFISRLSAGILGAWLYSKHPYAPYVMEVVVLSSAWFLSLFLQDKMLVKATAQSNREHIKEALGFVWKQRFLRDYFLAILLLALATESVWTGLQPYFLERDIDPKFFGLLFGSIALMSASGAYWSRRVASKLSGIKIKLYVAMVIVFGSWIMRIDAIWAVLLAILPMGFTFGLSDPIDNYTIQKHTSSKHQSTVLSLRDLFQTGIFSTASVLVGRYIDLYSTTTMIKILSFQTIVCTVLIFVIFKLNMRPLSKITG